MCVVQFRSATRKGVLGCSRSGLIGRSVCSVPPAVIGGGGEISNAVTALPEDMSANILLIPRRRRRLSRSGILSVTASADCN